MIVDTPSRAGELIAPFFAGEEGERVAVLHLDEERRLIATTFSPVGGAAEVDLPVRDILRAALQMGSAAIVVAHNHPSGDPTPSAEDIDATRRLAQAVVPAGIRFVDHLVFGGGEWRSFRELGLL
jgi:DNA repair protein RadC